MKRNYNRLALQGLQIDDMEFVEQFGLNPDVAYTPQINTEMSNAMYYKNIEQMINDGASEAEAKAVSGRRRKQVNDDIKKLLA
jgi:hypothetical protein